jgi:hypothetical protein
LIPECAILVVSGAAPVELLPDVPVPGLLLPRHPHQPALNFYIKFKLQNTDSLLNRESNFYDYII